MGKYKNNIMDISSKGSTLFALSFSAIVISLLLVSLPGIFAVTEQYGGPMNATIQQYISFTMSNNLTAGIFFTNDTGSVTGVQYNLTEMDAWNNGTGNFIGAGGGTVYNITAVAGNTAPIMVCHCVCGNLTCISGDCAAGSDYLYTTAGAQGSEGIEWGNGTTPTNVPTTPTQSYSEFLGTGEFQYQAVNTSLPASADIYLRYWLDPNPDTMTSGVYNTTYKFKIVEYTLNCDNTACSC